MIFTAGRGLRLSEGPRAGLWSAGYFVFFWLFGWTIIKLIPLPIIGAFITAIGIDLTPISSHWTMRSS